MKRIHVSTTIGAILTAAAAGLIFIDQRIAAVVCATLGYFCAMKEVSKYTSWYQFSVVFISSIVAGASVEFPFDKFPILTLSLFLAACGSILRIVLFHIFSYTSHTWYEPTVLIFSVSTHAYANAWASNPWYGWLTVPIVIFHAIIAWGIIKDKRQLLAYTSGGYRVQLGKTATEFELPDQDGNPVKLSDFKNKRHLLLIFVRGDWCPGCHMMLRTYEKNRQIFQSKNVFVMAIGPDPVGVNKGMVEKLGLDFKVLADDGQRTAMIYGVQLKEYDNNFAEKYEQGIPLPASFLIDIKGIVRYVSRPDKVGEFLNPSLIFPIIEKLN